MVRLTKGDMWTAYPTADLFCVTSNATLKQNGELVMGAGIAGEVRRCFPGLPRLIGKKLISVYGESRVLPDYGFYLLGKMALFQTKRLWHKKAELGLIELSTRGLLAYCQEHPLAQVHLNFPGIGRGGLPRNRVLPIIEVLPDSVTVWERS